MKRDKQIYSRLSKLEDELSDCFFNIVKILGEMKRESGHISDFKAQYDLKTNNMDKTITKKRPALKTIKNDD